MPDNSEIFDNDILGDYGRDVLETLLVDHSVTTAKNDGRTHHIFGQPMTMKFVAMVTASLTR